MKITDAELVILLAHEQGCSNYIGEGDDLCGLPLDEPEQECECLRIVRILREAIENPLAFPIIDEKLAEAELRKIADD
jgi:hypothetical protein